MRASKARRRAFARGTPGRARRRRTSPFLILALACTGGERDPGPLRSELPLHLEEHLEVAVVEGSVPTSVREPVSWSFDEPQPDWKPAHPLPTGFEPLAPVAVEDALRLPLTGANRNPETGRLAGNIFVALPDWSFEDWSLVEIRARTTDRMRSIGLDFNYDRERPYGAGVFPFTAGGEFVPLVTDGTIQTYRLPVDRVRTGHREDRFTHLSIWVNAPEEASVDILSVRVIPREAVYAHAPVGVRTEGRLEHDDRSITSPDRRCIFMHAPGRLSFPIVVPEEGRLDVGLGVVRDGEAVRFRVVADRGGRTETLLERTWTDAHRWSQQAIDLAHLTGERLHLRLEAGAEREGLVALWATPTVSGRRITEKPNVVFYVIDGGGADYMSAFGYERRTTPNLERLISEGALFERAHSTASWTRPSTATFSTSLHHSVLGGLQNGSNPIPTEAPTMAELMHGAGYLTALLTANANAGRVNRLERGVDHFRDAGVEPNSVSSVELHESFWSWREDYPAEPYWVHFQTTDVHNDHHPVEPFAGTFIDPARRETAEAWLERANELEDGRETTMVDAVDAIGVPQTDYWRAQWDLHDETMLHQDHQLGELVSRLKSSGEWERTLFILAADHSVAAGSWDYDLLARDPQPRHLFARNRASPMLRRGVSHVPLLFIWPGHIQPGLRLREPVSMIDVLPTMLDLVGLPRPRSLQGRSLAQVLLGEEGWEPRPIYLDEFQVDPETGEPSGRIEIIDGRWGASLDVNPDPDAPASDRRPSPLLLYDLERDPDALHSVHDRHPELARKYEQLLRRKLREHLSLAERYTRPDDSPLTPEQLETLRSLGYL